MVSQALGEVLDNDFKLPKTSRNYKGGDSVLEMDITTLLHPPTSTTTSSAAAAGIIKRGLSGDLRRSRGGRGGGGGSDERETEAEAEEGPRFSNMEDLSSLRCQ